MIGGTVGRRGRGGEGAYECIIRGILKPRDLEVEEEPTEKLTEEIPFALLDHQGANKEEQQNNQQAGKAPP